MADCALQDHFIDASAQTETVALRDSLTQRRTLTHQEPWTDTMMRRLRITIGNKSYEVTVEDITDPGTPPHSPAIPQHSIESVSAHASKQQSEGQVDLRGKASTHVAGAVTSPMAGGVLSILVKSGDHVTKGQTLVVLEAMKMENQIIAPEEGTVQSIEVKQGQIVQEGQTLLVLE